MSTKGFVFPAGTYMHYGVEGGVLRMWIPADDLEINVGVPWGTFEKFGKHIGIVDLTGRGLEFCGRAVKMSMQSRAPGLWDHAGVHVARWFSWISRPGAISRYSQKVLPENVKVSATTSGTRLTMHATFPGSEPFKVEFEGPVLTPNKSHWEGYVGKMSYHDLHQYMEDILHDFLHVSWHDATRHFANDVFLYLESFHCLDK